MSSALKLIEGAGNTGCLAHPQTRVREYAQRCTRANYRHAATVRRSLRNELTAYTRSPRSAGLVSLRRRRIIFRQLDASVGASGPRDFAVCEISALVRRGP